MKQKELSLVLKVILVVCFLALALLACWAVPSVGAEFAEGLPDLAWLFWPSLIVFWLTCLPVAAALVLVWRISGDIGRDSSFSLRNARRMKQISILALGDTAAYVVCAVVLLVLNALHPGVALLFFGVELFGVSVAVIAALLSHMIRKAAVLKADQDLTI